MFRFVLKSCLIIIIISFASSIYHVLAEDSSSWCDKRIRQNQSQYSLRNLVCPLGRYK